MLRASQILVRTFAPALCAASLVACGQRGPLYLPTAPEAAQRASLPDTLRLNRDNSAPAAPATPRPVLPAPPVLPTLPALPAEPDAAVPDAAAASPSDHGPTQE